MTEPGSPTPTADAPLVSVILPTWNRRPLLPQAVDSVLNQTLDRLELIVVDDGSTDGTAAYLDGIPDPRIRRVRLAHTGNVARARNAGAAVARGRFLAFIDSDDVWAAEKLAEQMDVMRGAEGCWTYTRYDHLDERGVPIPARGAPWQAFSGDIALDILAQRAGVTIVTVVLERTLFESLGGFNERPRIREDYEFVVRLAVHTPARAVPRSLASVRDHPGRTTRGRSRARSELGAVATFDALLEWLPADHLRRAARRQRARHHAEAAGALLRERSIGAGLGSLLAAIRGGATPREIVMPVRRALGLNRRLLRSVGRPVLGRGSPAWLLLRSPALRLRAFDDPVDCMIYGLLLSGRVQFVQIGSNDGVTNDPLWTFRRYRDWSGVLVEPQQDAFDRLARNYAPWRDRFVLECAAVAARAGTRVLYQCPEGRLPGHDQLASLDADHIRKWCDMPESEELAGTPVRCLTYRLLLDKHGISAPDLVHVDAEGLDAEVLEQVELDGEAPALLLYEHVHLPDAVAAHLRARLEGAGYEMIEIGGDTMAVSATALRERPALRSAWRQLTAYKRRYERVPQPIAPQSDS